MKLQNRLLWITGAVLAVLTLLNLWLSYRAFATLVDEEMAKEARNVRAMLMATRRVYHQQFIDSELDLTDKTIGFLPAHALARISQDFPNWTNSGMTFNNVSDRPRNPANRADFNEMQAIAWFRANPQAKEHIGEITGSDGKAYYHYTTPMWIEAYCLKCHGKQEEAPVSIRHTYAESYGYQLGDLRGVISIKIPLVNLRERIWSMWLTDSLTHLVIFGLLFVILAWLLRRTVTLRLSRLKVTARQLTAGDYRQRADLSGTDEIGTLALALNQMAYAVEQRDSDLRRFSEITAHHLQEPARRIASFADLLGKQLAGKLTEPKAQRSLDFISQQARYQQNLLRDVQRYLAADQPRGAMAQVNTKAVVKGVLESLTKPITAAQAQIVVGELPPVWFDAARLGDVFELLLDNALHHAAVPAHSSADPHDLLHIGINGERIGDMVRFCVSDNGPGIEAQYRERVFRVFERLKSGGTNSGIGLALVRRIVENSGGRAWIKETPGGGCSVFFALPQKDRVP